MCNQQHAIHVVTQGVVLCIVSADHIMALPASPSKGNCPAHDNFLTSKRLLPPSQGDWLEKLLLNPGDGKVKLMLLWNLNRKKKENRPVDIKWKRCHIAKSDANPERQEERHQMSGSCCCVFIINAHCFW